MFTYLGAFLFFITGVGYCFTGDGALGSFNLAVSALFIMVKQ